MYDEGYQARLIGGIAQLPVRIGFQVGWVLHREEEGILPREIGLMSDSNACPEIVLQPGDFFLGDRKVRIRTLLGLCRQHPLVSEARLRGQAVRRW